MIPDIPIDIRKRLAGLKNFLLLPDFANFLPSKTEQANMAENLQSQEATKKIQFCQSYSYVNSKVWYHQIWIQNNLGFMVSGLMYVGSWSGSGLYNDVFSWNMNPEK